MHSENVVLVFCIQHQRTLTEAKAMMFFLYFSIMDTAEGSHTRPFPAPCLGLFLRPRGFHPQQTLAWPWRTWSGSCQRKPPGQKRAAAAGGGGQRSQN